MLGNAETQALIASLLAEQKTLDAEAEVLRTKSSSLTADAVRAHESYAMITARCGESRAELAVVEASNRTAEDKSRERDRLRRAIAAAETDAAQCDVRRRSLQSDADEASGNAAKLTQQAKEKGKQAVWDTSFFDYLRVEITNPLSWWAGAIMAIWAGWHGISQGWVWIGIGIWMALAFGAGWLSVRLLVGLLEIVLGIAVVAAAIAALAGLISLL